MSMEQELKALPYREHLKALMAKAREAKDIWLMLTIQDRINEETK